MIPAQATFEMLEGNPSAVLIDVRSDMEYLMVGHPGGAVHIAWIDAPDWTVNPNFVAEVRKVLLGRNANRSQDAADLLMGDGLRKCVRGRGRFRRPSG